jgi:hypothetical protein
LKKEGIETEWFPANDGPVKEGDWYVLGRIIELKENDKLLPALEHRIMGTKNKDIASTWATPEKVSPTEYATMRKRFSLAFDAYEAEKVGQADRKAKEEAEKAAAFERAVAAAVEAKLAQKEATVAVETKLAEKTKAPAKKDVA